MRSSGDGLRRELGVWSAVAIVVGTVIGSGIFLVPKTMALNVGTPGMVTLVWIFGGLLSMCGALSYAELAAAMPEAGGEYVFLREAYGPLWAFLYGWMQTPTPPRPATSTCFSRNTESFSFPISNSVRLSHWVGA